MTHKLPCPWPSEMIESFFSIFISLDNRKKKLVGLAPVERTKMIGENFVVFL